MTTADGRTGGAVPPGHMRPLLLVAIVVLAAALVLFLAPSSAAASSDVTWVAPEPDSDVKETISLEVRISANVTNVTFSYDGGSGLQLIGNGTFSAPDLCSINWATDWVPDGTYALVANASLSGGGHAEARVSDIRVDNTDPSIEIISPLPDQRVRGYYTIRVNCSKDIAYLEVFYYIGSGYVSLGLPQYDDVSGQWRLVWNTTFFDDQEALELIATGRDAAGNVQTTSAIDIHVDNVPPRPVLVQPEDNATLDGYVYLKADCSEPFLEDVHFEWRDAGYGWSMIGSAVWNATQELWVLHWNTYPVGEHEDVEIRVTAVDDLGQEDHDNATGVVITDIPPSPVFLTPEEGTHLTGTFEVRVWSQNDTRSMEFFYLKRGEWLPIGDAVGQEDGEWNLTWDTAGINLYETTIKAVAYDGSGSGNSSLEGIQVDNISPAPQLRDAWGVRIPPDR